VANPTTVLADLTHAVDALAASPDVDLVAVFGPEHGFRGAAQVTARSLKLHRHLHPHPPPIRTLPGLESRETGQWLELP